LGFALGREGNRLRARETQNRVRSTDLDAPLGRAVARRSGARRSARARPRPRFLATSAASAAAAPRRPAPRGGRGRWRLAGSRDARPPSSRRGYVQMLRRARTRYPILAPPRKRP
jgi:hypothetical protein